MRPGRSRPEGMKAGRPGYLVEAGYDGIARSGPRRGLGRKGRRVSCVGKREKQGRE